MNRRACPLVPKLLGKKSLMNDINIRIRKPAYERLRKRAWKEKKSIKDLVDELSAPRKRTAIVSLKGV